MEKKIKRIIELNIVKYYLLFNIEESDKIRTKIITCVINDRNTSY
jgi:hypothetical protein